MVECMDVCMAGHMAPIRYGQLIAEQLDACHQCQGFAAITDVSLLLISTKLHVCPIEHNIFGDLKLESLDQTRKCSLDKPFDC